MPFPFDHKYPGTDLHEIDLYYALEEVKQLHGIVKNFVDLNKITYADPIYWNITKQYPAAQIVKDPVSGVLYMSKQPVPVDIALTNTDYWLEIGNFEYETGFIKDAICANDEGSATTASQAYEADEYLWWNDKLYKTTAAISAGDTLTVGTNVKETSITDNLVPEIPPQEMNETAAGLINFTRKFWIDATNFTSIGRTHERSMQGYAEDDDYYYISFITSDNQYCRIVKVNKTTYETTYHQYDNYTMGHANSICCIGDYLYVVNGSTGARITKVNKNSWSYQQITTPVQFGNIAYDEITGKVYCRGTNAGGDYDQIYEVEGLENNAPVVVRTITCEGMQYGTRQGIAAYDDVIFRCWSNPNMVAAYDANTGELRQYMPLENRFDGIIPVGELEDMDVHDGILSVIGQNVALYSMATYISCIGAYDLYKGAPVNQIDDNSYPYYIYVDPTAQQYYNNIGSQDVPFTTLWEAVECAIGYKVKTGVKSHIFISGINTEFPEIRVSGDSIAQLSATSGNYARINGIEARDGNIVLQRLFIGTRSNKDGASALMANQAVVNVNDCGFIYDSNVNSTDYTSVIETAQNSRINLQNVRTAGTGAYAGIVLWDDAKVSAVGIPYAYAYSGVFTTSAQGVLFNFKPSASGDGYTTPLKLGTVTITNAETQSNVRLEMLVNPVDGIHRHQLFAVQYKHGNDTFTYIFPGGSGTDYTIDHDGERIMLRRPTNGTIQFLKPVVSVGDIITLWAL